MLLLALLAGNCQQSGSSSAQKNAKEAKVSLMEASELQQILSEQGEIQLIDVRTPKEFKEGTIGDAVNINFFDPDFEAQLMEVVDPQKPLYLFCRSGRRSGNAAEKLKKSGFVEIYDLKGGYLSWQAEN